MKLNSLHLASALGALSLTVASANHIDFVVDGAFDITNSGQPPTSATQTGAGGNIIGGERNISLIAESGGMRAFTSPSVASGAGPVGAGDSSSFIGVTGDDADSIGALTLLYNGTGDTGLNGGAGADFDTTWNFFGVNMRSVSGGPLDIRLTATDASGNMGEAQIADVDSAGIYSFAFGDSRFTNAGVDFTTITSVQLDFETTVGGVEYEIAGITREVIPEPSTGLLGLIGACVLAVRRRRA